jgi:GMP synthase-like glutamine amidotransferase
VIIGILETDVLNEEVQLKYGSYPEMFKNLLLKVDDTLKFKSYQVINFQYPDNISECDAYLITGSQFSAYDDLAWINQLKVFIKRLVDYQIKLVGICFGHQLIAQALKGRVEKSDKGWGVGLITSEVKIKPAALQMDSSQFSLLVSHQDQVVVLPDDAELLAGNDFCPNASYIISNSVLTFQGHPEFSVEYLKSIMNKRRVLIGEENYKKSLLTLKNRVDDKKVALWIVNFIKDKL